MPAAFGVQSSEFSSKTEKIKQGVPPAEAESQNETTHSTAPQKKPVNDRRNGNLSILNMSSGFASVIKRFLILAIPKLNVRKREKRSPNKRIRTRPDNI